LNLLLYYITDRTQFPGNENDRWRALLAKIEESVACGVDLIQLREKDLFAHELESLAHKVRRVVGNNSRLLVNSRTDVAIASHADGVHLRSDDISPSEVRKIWARNSVQAARPTVAVSCHTVEDVVQAEQEDADFAVFAPVFEKKNEVRPNGLEEFRRVCQHKIPVLALGGITLENARSCIDAGASGIAGIRLFQDNDIANIVRDLRA
jgi:thiamine-phosphate pyrophosphorylase